MRKTSRFFGTLAPIEYVDKKQTNNDYDAYMYLCVDFNRDRLCCMGKLHSPKICHTKSLDTGKDYFRELQNRFGF